MAVSVAVSKILFCCSSERYDAANTITAGFPLIFVVILVSPVVPSVSRASRYPLFMNQCPRASAKVKSSAGMAFLMVFSMGFILESYDSFFWLVRGSDGFFFFLSFRRLRFARFVKASQKVEYAAEAEDDY